MPHKLMLPLLLLLVSTVPLLHADDSLPLTNDTILQMVKGHLADAQIIAVIQGNDAGFDLSTAAIIALKSKNVSDSVVHEMFNANLKSAGVAPAAPAPLAPPAPAPAPVPAPAPARKALDPPQAPDPPQAGAANVPAQIAAAPATAANHASASAAPANAPAAQAAPAAPPAPAVAAAPSAVAAPPAAAASAAPAPHAPPAPAPAPAAPGSPTELSSKFAAGFVGGVEQSGYSSQASSTNAFLNAFFRSPYWGISSSHDDLAASIWGRIRLLSGPLPSTVNVAAAITNPAGTITASNLANVGQVVDYVFGPELRLKQWGSDRLSFVAGAGATTPLTSNQIQYSLQAPPANSQQCLQLVATYPSFLTNGSTAPACTLVNKLTNQSVSTISFAAVDRTNFLVKYGGGARLTHTFLSQDSKKTPYTGTVDFIIGQDQSITGGKFHGAVFRVDGIYPLPFGTSSYLYLFGSASMKFTKNVFSNPIVLATAPSPSLPLATTVALLPLTQPDRDFYRFGVGLNIMSIFTKLKGDGTSNNGAANKGNGTTPKTSGATVNNP